MITLDECLIRAVKDTGNISLLDEIQDACRNKQAFCFGADDVRIVLKPRSHNGIPYVVVWLGVSTSMNGLEHYTPKVQELTRMIGGRWAEFYTVRKGFIRKAKQLGFERLPDEDGLMKFQIPV